jgi:transposase, IS5 family
MTLLSFSEAEHASKRKRIWQEVLLYRTGIEPCYSGVGRDRHLYGMDTMLRIRFLQQRYALSDPAIEEVLSEIASM